MNPSKASAILTAWACVGLASLPAIAQRGAPHEYAHEAVREQMREQMGDRAVNQQGLRTLPLSMIAERAEQQFGIEPESVSGPPEARRRFYDNLNYRLPGKQLTLATLLDRQHFQPDLQDIDATWRQRSGQPSLEFPGESARLEHWFGLHQQETVMLVGHLVGADFVLTDAHGKERSRLPLAQIKAAAERHGSVFVPIGCKSAQAGAALGYTHNIDAAKVSALLRALDLQPTLGSLVRAMQSIGHLKIDAVSAASIVLTQAPSDPLAGNDTGELEIQVDLPAAPVAASPATAAAPDTALFHAMLFSIALTLLLWRSQNFFDQLPHSPFLLAKRSRSPYVGMAQHVSRIAEWARKGMLALSALLVLAFIIVINR